MNEVSIFNFADLKISACESINNARQQANNAQQLGGLISAIIRRFVCHSAIKAIRVIAEESNITMTSPLASKMAQNILGRGVGTEIIRVHFADENRTASDKMATNERDRAIDLAIKNADLINELINEEVDYLKRFAKTLNDSVRIAEIKRLYNSEPSQI